jgi:hypothetical protein
MSVETERRDRILVIRLAREAKRDVEGYSSGGGTFFEGRAPEGRGK